MPTKIEKDALSGRETTGHEWDGLKELNNPLPKWWVYVLGASVVWAFALFVLYPSWPYVTGHTNGLLHYSQRATVDANVKALAAKRAVYMDKIAATPIEAVKQDPQLLAMAMTAGRITFANNCAPCHGTGGEGRVGYPNLADDVWIGAASWPISRRRSRTASAAAIPMRAPARCRSSAPTASSSRSRSSRSPIT